MSTLIGQLHKLQFDLSYSVLINNLYDIVSWGNYQTLCGLIYRASENFETFFQRTLRVVISEWLRSVSHRNRPREGTPGIGRGEYLAHRKRAITVGDGLLTGPIN